VARFIIHHKGAYNIWTTVADGACFESALTEEQLRQYIEMELGKQGLMELPERIARAKEKGCSSIDNTTLEELLLCNRAGKNESTLSYREFVEKFLTLSNSSEADNG
jgi:hypothetical protein